MNFEEMLTKKYKLTNIYYLVAVHIEKKLLHSPEFTKKYKDKTNQ